MPEYCTCGAKLPEYVLFAIEVRKAAARDIIEPEVQANIYQGPPAPTVVLDAAPPPRPQPLPMNFHNPIAVRIALVAAVSATILNFLLMVNWLAAAFWRCSSIVEKRASVST